MKYRVTAIVFLDVEADSESKAVEQAKEMIPSFIRVHNFVRPTLINAPYKDPFQKRRTRKGISPTV
jgi:hypothetical protein